MNPPITPPIIKFSANSVIPPPKELLLGKMCIRDRYYIEELDAMQVPEHLRNYIDYEAYGRDVALEESGDFTDLGYVRDTGSSFHEYYDGCLLYTSRCV